MTESSAEIVHRLPDRVVQKDAALANRAMKLCGDEAGLLLHPIRVRLPSFQKSRNFLSLDSEKVDENDGRGGDGKLPIDGESWIEGAVA
jgi:hypothetical protein